MPIPELGYPAGSRWSGPSTQRKDVNNLPAVANPADATVDHLKHQRPGETMTQNGVSVGQDPEVFFKSVTLTPEARRIARILGMRSAEYLAQRVIDAETTIEQLVARVEKLERA